MEIVSGHHTDPAPDGGNQVAPDGLAEDAGAEDASPATWADTDAGDLEEPGPGEGDEVEEGEALDPAEELTVRRRRALAEARRSGLPPRMESWRKRTATGAVLTGFALGFQQALGTEQQKPAIIMEASGDPPSDLPVDAEVDQIRPADNVVRIRPWLLAEESEDPAEPGGNPVGNHPAGAGIGDDVPGAEAPGSDDPGER